MRLRLIILVLALLSIMSSSIGGYLYYSSLKNAAIEESSYIANELLNDISNHIDFYLAGFRKSVKALAGSGEIQKALESKDEDSLANANSILDRFKDALEVSVCYLLDNSGNTIASSNRNAPDSFVGKNYSFRPYFRQALKGNPSVYMALGVTSKKRGGYFSYPVYGQGKASPSGVVVIKAFIDEINAEINRPYEGIMLLSGPMGIVFIANREDWIYHSLWRLSSREISEIAKSRQFGNGPWNWTGVERIDNHYALDKSGKEYHLHQRGIDSYPGWNIIYLHNHDKVVKKISAPLFKTSGYIILTLCVLIGIAVTMLYKKASFDMVRRKRAEDALKKHLEMEKQFNRDLEPLVAERTMSLIALTVADKVRNPATIIGLISKRLLKKPGEPDKLKEGLDDIITETDKLDRIVHDYKALLDSRKTMFQYDDINDVLRDALTLIETEAGRKEIKLVISLYNEPLRINIQRNLMRMAIFHLLANAVEATSGGGIITTSTSRSEEKVFLVISDTGKGFKKEHLEKIFDPFFSTKTHSYGMGLPLVRHIVLEHMGTIEVESKEGEGTSFKMSFPARWV